MMTDRVHIILSPRRIEVFWKCEDESWYIVIKKGKLPMAYSHIDGSEWVLLGYVSEALLQLASTLRTAVLKAKIGSDSAEEILPAYSFDRLAFIWAEKSAQRVAFISPWKSWDADLLEPQVKSLKTAAESLRQMLGRFLIEVKQAGYRSTSSKRRSSRSNFPKSRLGSKGDNPL
jgi:hypothetical protein